ncbi:DUF58 domain-containing protein [Telmatocola sphagniphila]|uniref:DUF58 domain-containing protein n=1 Tax=Telmatocola sphagniphila TaxID=1123043 RepID=A0A8E6B6E1_9BACT|nr:DUF58 domain-containing protein [Telmatocola sphagniphila]QVL32940.1 DUF58 domain-containing protein [Telmatocola sphagniphila]
MLTTRGWWLTVLALLQAAMGFILSQRGGMALAVLGVTILCWLLVEWIRFRIHLSYVVPRLQFQRIFRAEGRVIRSSFPNQKITVSIAFKNPARVSLPLFQFRDLVPAGAFASPEATGNWISLPRRGQTEISYTIQPQLIGLLTFHGIGLRLSDLHGLFSYRLVLHDPIELPILPLGLRRVHQPRSTKRHNVLPALGTQRFLRPGGAGDLLDLRDYLPGDPPKMIAWKQSARRDKLITRELESEVPLRCTLFLDASPEMIDSPEASSVKQVLVETSAAILESLLRNRDYVGLYTFDEASSRGMKPSRSSRHRIEMLQRLSEVGQPVIASHDVEWITQQTHAVASEIYPNLMTPRRNSTPLTLAWEPVLDSAGAWLIILLLTAPLLLLWPRIRLFLDDILALTRGRSDTDLSLMFGLISAGIGLFAFFVFGLQGYWPSRRNRTHRRKQLAALFTAFDRRPAREISFLRENDEEFTSRCRDFLRHHSLEFLGNSTPPPLEVPSPGEFKVDHLNNSLIQCVTRARDNELFVILGNFAESQAAWPRLLRAIRLIRARHHEVVFICQRFRLEKNLPEPRDQRLSALQKDLRKELMRLYDEQLLQFQTRVRRLGVQLLWADDDDTVARIVQKMSDLRAARIRR